MPFWQPFLYSLQLLKSFSFNNFYHGVTFATFCLPSLLNYLILLDSIIRLKNIKTISKYNDIKIYRLSLDQSNYDKNHVMLKHINLMHNLIIPIISIDLITVLLLLIYNLNLIILIIDILHLTLIVLVNKYYKKLANIYSYNVKAPY